MSKPILKVVSKCEAPTSIPVDQRKRIISLHAQLMRAVLLYVADGKDGSRNDRIRMASSMSGIPETLIRTASPK